MDSSLIPDHAETLAGRGAQPVADRAGRAPARAAHHGTGAGGCEKAVQIGYERELRPPEKQHQPWLDRVPAERFALQATFAQQTEALPLLRDWPQVWRSVFRRRTPSSHGSRAGRAGAR